MRKILIALMLSATVLSVSAKKAVHEKKKGFTSQPGMELVTKAKNGNLRAWAVGKADRENAARAMAMKDATAELAEALQRCVDITTKSFMLVEDNATKEMMSRDFQIVAQQQLNGVIQIYDKWAAKDSDGMFRNYVVLELRGDQLIDKLYDKYKSKQEKSDAKDKVRLQKIYEKVVSEQ